MDVRHLALLRELADRGSLSAVAQASYRTPSAVSQQLRTAEREFGLRLTEPDGRGVRLTAAGQVLAAGAVDVATALARVEADLDRLRDSPGARVTMAALPSAAEVLVPPLLTRLDGTGVHVEVTDVDLAEEEFPRRTRDDDVVVGHSMAPAGPSGSAGLSVVRVVTEPLDIAIPLEHRLAALARVGPDDVADEPWIGVPPGFPFDTVRAAVEAAAGRPMTVVQRVRDNRVVEALVAAGHGIALLPRFTTRPRDGMVTRPLVGVPAQRYIVALSRPDRAQGLGVRRVVDTLVGIGAELAG